MSCFQRLASWSFVVFGWAVLGFGGTTPALASDGTTVQFIQPIVCEIGKNCWPVNHVDHDPSDGIRDYRCGRQTYNGHKGTDFAVEDMEAVRAGVDVVAAMVGDVVGVRDGMVDRNYKTLEPGAIANRECGNGVLLKHDGNWFTQYCHMRQGSIRVKAGDHVSPGQKLGEVGLSGKTVFPHLHFEVRHDKKVYDPFVGIERANTCAKGPMPLWNAQVDEALQYQPLRIALAGFSAAAPKLEGIQDGLYRDRTLPDRAPVLYLWVQSFWTNAGDDLKMIITDPSGKVVLDYKNKIEKNQAQSMFFAGLKRDGMFWDKGHYHGRIEILRPDKFGDITFVKDVEVEIR